MIRIYFTYRHIDGPWGGANNFIRALHEDLSRSGAFAIVESPAAGVDIVFMNQLGSGPAGGGKSLSIRVVRRLMADCEMAGRKPKLVVRAVNLNRHAFQMGVRNATIGLWQDRQTVALLNLADLVVFQSAYQRDFFVDAGYSRTANVVIHNGGSKEFWVEQLPSVPPEGPLRFISSSASVRATKRHDLIAKLSRCEGVEVWHLGAWPRHLACENVRLLGMQPRERMIEAMGQCHYFLHPAIKDPCPNSIFEAVCAGLPVIYGPGPGSSAEIVAECGIPLEEGDLPATIVRARRELLTLRERVRLSRERFTIGNAAMRYRQVFSQVVTSAGANSAGRR